MEWTNYKVRFPISRVQYDRTPEVNQAARPCATARRLRIVLLLFSDSTTSHRCGQPKIECMLFFWLTHQTAMPAVSAWSISVVTSRLSCSAFALGATYKAVGMAFVMPSCYFCCANLCSLKTLACRSCKPPQTSSSRNGGCAYSIYHNCHLICQNMSAVQQSAEFRATHSSLQERETSGCVGASVQGLRFAQHTHVQRHLCGMHKDDIRVCGCCCAGAALQSAQQAHVQRHLCGLPKDDVPQSPRGAAGTSLTFTLTRGSCLLVRLCLMRKAKSLF